ncbi:ABC transporter transmembrane domain-containing protein [Legionella erythra]|uniref:ABC transporter transmembrane domain-containing protein n=1 Tax=Legionella erythra TaxID=448 RepID=UPI00138ED4E5|nr:ABC transporter transmembrane domain-containing protein [Legionella erythra]
MAHFSTGVLFHKIRENGLLIALSISINVCALALPVYTLQAYDRIITNQNFSTFFILTLGAFLFIAFEFLFRLLRSNLISYYANKNKHVEFIRAIQQFARIKPEKLVHLSLAEKSEIINELSKTNDFIYRQLYVALVDILFLVLFLAVIALLSIKLSLVILAVLLVFTLIAIRINLSIIRQHKNRAGSDEKRLAGIINFLRSIFIAKMYANESLLLQKQDIIERKAVVNTYKLSISLSFLYNFSTFTTQILIVATLVIGASQVITGYLTFGTLIATIIIAGRLTNPIREMLTLWFRVATYLNSNEKLLDFYNQNTRTYLKGQLSAKYLYALDMEKVTVKENYKTSKPAISGLTIQLTIGQCAAITQMNSHQRALLKKLLTGAIKPDSGDIRVLGNPLYKLSSEQFHHLVGYITIEEHFINGTILENMTGGRDIADEEIEALCQLFNMKHDILQLEYGFQTVLNANTLQELPLSLRVKILLVRCYIFRPRVVIVDTDDEYVDEQLYQMLFKFLKAIREQSAMLILSNDYNLVNIADYCYRLDECRYHALDIENL